jgi:cytochrome P450
MTSATIPTSDVDLFADETLYDPYPAYAELRESGPAVYLERHDAWALSRYEDVRAALRDWHLYSPAEGVGLNEPMNELMKGTVLASIPPEHTKLRASTASCLAPKVIKGMADRLQLLADETVESAIAMGTFDAIEQLAQGYTMKVMGEMIGFPAEVRDHLLEWADSAFQVNGPQNERYHASMPAMMEMIDYLANVDEAELHPGGMALTVLAAAREAGLDESPLPGLLRTFTTAAIDTTVSGIGHAIWRFALHPDQWELVRADALLVPAADNEVLRMDAPIQLFSRLLTAPARYGDVEVGTGQRVLLMFGSANRDGRHYDDPDRFDVRRNPADHLAFGYGLHSCLGRSLARMEMQCVVRSLAARVKAFHAETAQRPQRHLNNLIRSIECLPVSVEC